MTVANPEPGEIFYDEVRKTRLFYIGRDASERWITEDLSDMSAPYIGITTAYAKDHLVTWTEELTNLERDQIWGRSRNDFTGQQARILSVFDYIGDTWIVYAVIYGGASPGPKIKQEIDFRRVFGNLINGDDNG